MSDCKPNMDENEFSPVIVEYETILERLGGYNYFTREQIMFVYLSLNNLKEEAEVYLNECLTHAKLLERNYFKKMVSPEEIGTTI
jgi:hypothetical protein